ncbi:hypothetical protein [Streptomyces sp. NPDC002788]
MRIIVTRATGDIGSVVGTLRPEGMQHRAGCPRRLPDGPGLGTAPVPAVTDTPRARTGPGTADDPIWRMAGDEASRMAGDPICRVPAAAGRRP